MKNGKYFLIFILAIYACSSQPKADVNELISIDKEFSKRCLENGMKDAFLFYADDSVIKMQPREFPIMGKDALKKFYDEGGADADVKFGWEPVKADIATSGDLGYTFGNWIMEFTDDSTTSKHYGNYISIWKRNAKGEWKYVLDGGNSTPAPEN
jgi:ketosteroid isomerase-like protein